jgi:phosphoenolpyruvate synthase/pyruvate phosphate dikinase
MINVVGTAEISRLGISYPELTEMQARAIFEAAITMTNQGVQVFPEIMVPLVGTPQACIFFSFFFCVCVLM